MGENKTEPCSGNTADCSHASRELKDLSKFFEEELKNDGKKDNSALFFKYVYSTSSDKIEYHINKARKNANWPLSIGIALIVIGILFFYSALFSNFDSPNGDKHILVLKYIAAFAGLVTLFTAAVTLFLYSKVLNQINSLMEKYLGMQKMAVSYVSQLETGAAQTDRPSSHEGAEAGSNANVGSTARNNKSG